jgi:hypothetical protein
MVILISLIALPLIGGIFSILTRGIDFVARIVLGVFTVVAVSSFSVMLSPKESQNRLIILVWALFLIGSFLGFLVIRNFSLPRLLTVSQMISLLLILLTYALISPSGIRYHSSPDSYGFAATTGYFTENFSLSHLKGEYLTATGLDKAVFIGQSSPKLESVWHIPDSQLRFASDMVFQVGRIGWPSFFAVLGNLPGNLPTLFPWLLLLFSAIGIWAVASLMLKVCFQSFYLIHSKENANIKRRENEVEHENLLTSRISWDGKKLLSLLLISASTFILGFTTWSATLVLEGALTQIWSLVAILYQISLLLDFKNYKKELLKRSFIVYLISPVFLAVSYPNAIPLFIIIISPIFLALYSHNKYSHHRSAISKNVVWSILGVILSLPIAWYLIKDSFSAITGNFLSGAGNQPYSLGFIQITNLFAQPLNQVRIERVSSTSQGFEPLNQEVLPAMIQIVLVLLIIVTLLVSLRKNRLARYLLLIPMALGLQSLSTVLPGKDNYFPYIYLRNLTNLLVIGLPIVLGFAFAVYVKKKSAFILKYRVALQSFCLVILTIAIFSSVEFGKGWKVNSTPLLNFSSNLQEFDLENSIVVTDYPENGPFGMTLVSKVNYLTDNWQPEFDPTFFKGDTFKVYEYLNNNSAAPLKLLGYIKVNLKIKGPLTKDQIVSATSFKPVGSK